MRIARPVVSLVAVLLIAGVYARLGESAEEDAAATKSEAGERPDTIPIPKVLPFDFSQLPIRKTIGVPPADARLFEALNKPAEFTIVKMTLPDFANEVAVKHKISVKLDTPALTSDGKGSDTILSGSTRNTSLRSALHLFLDEQGLTFVVRNETLLITTRTAAEVLTSTRIYQVHDLVLYPGDPSLRPELEKLTRLVTSLVQPESWREAGGTQGDCHGFEAPGLAALVIHQTDEGHEQIEKLLADLRAAKIPALHELQKKRERAPPVRPVPSATPPAVRGGGFF